MKSYLSKTKGLALLAVLLTGFLACGVGSNTGRLSLSLTDKPTNDYEAVYVTIREIAVHAADDPEDVWTPVPMAVKTVNLKALTNGVREQLGIVSLAPGHYTQMRLIVGDASDGGVNILSQVHPSANYVIDKYTQLPENLLNLYHDLKVPSGMQTGIKIGQGFDIDEDETTELILDFDARKSVVVAGSSDNYLLKPTIQVLNTALASIISGTVSWQKDPAPAAATAVGDALVSAQVYDPNPVSQDPKDQVIVRTETYTDDTDTNRGAYKLFIAAGNYNLVASKLDAEPLLGPSTHAVDTVAESVLKDEDFVLDAFAAEKLGTLGGTVTVTDPPVSDPPGVPFVSISIRQKVTLASGDVMIEVWFDVIASGGSYTVKLPAGTYDVVAWTFNKTTFEAKDLLVEATKSKTQDISF